VGEIEDPRQIEGVEHFLGNRPPPVERIEQDDAIRAADHSLAVDRE
jgi:hypothetical protein